jgi:hypothetical protein
MDCSGALKAKPELTARSALQAPAVPLATVVPRALVAPRALGPESGLPAFVPSAVRRQKPRPGPRQEQLLGKASIDSQDCSNQIQDATGGR